MNIRKYIAILMSWIFIQHRYRIPNQTNDEYLAKAQNAVRFFLMLFFVVLLTPFVAYIMRISLGKNLWSYILLGANYLIINLFARRLSQSFTLDDVMPLVENNDISEKMVRKRLVLFFCIYFSVLVVLFLIVMRFTEI
jgi:hypothetical protein